jgi:hypothetical protein
MQGLREKLYTMPNPHYERPGKGGGVLAALSKRERRGRKGEWWRQVCALLNGNGGEQRKGRCGQNSLNCFKLQTV